MSADRDAKMDKIRKCLRMGKSANSNEAATAMRMAWQNAACISLHGACMAPA